MIESHDMRAELEIGQVYTMNITEMIDVSRSNTKSVVEWVRYLQKPLMFVGYQDANDILPFLEIQEREPLAVFLGNNGEWCLLRSQANKAAKLIEVQPC